MTQQEILNLLKEHKKRWFTTKKIAKVLGINKKSASTSLKSLRHTNWLDFKIGHYNKYLYKYKTKQNAKKGNL